MSRRVAIIGAGITKFGELWELGFRELITEAGVKAIEDAGIEGDEIEALYGGTMSAGRFIGQEHIGALIADQTGMNPIPSTRVEAACASGSIALRQAYISVMNGLYDMVIAGGVEKMTDVGTEDATVTLSGAGDQEWEAFQGATFPGLYALMARRHMHDYGTKQEHLAAVAVKNHKNGFDNPIAQYHIKISRENAINSPVIADPLRLLDCSPISDGAAAVVLASEKVAKNYCDNPVWIDSCEQASDTLALATRESITEIKATRIASKKAYKRAGVTPKDIDVAELHDCFTIGEIMAVEDLGFVQKGDGGPAIAEGRFDLNSGEISTNTSGGLKACGHPVGATGIKQAVEITQQLRGQAGKRQVRDAKIGLSQNVGGTGATVVVTVYKKE